jgi:glycosyltransferase involved in cell wall biosynthesis
MKNLNISCPLGGTGYGIASINILRELEKDNHISLFPIGSPHPDNEEDVKLIQKLIMNQDTFDYDAPFLKIWHQFDLANKIGNEKYFAFPFFELDTFTSREIHNLNYVDHLIVSSQWAKSVIEENNVKTKVSVAPLGVDRTIFNEKKNSEEAMSNLPYVFINIGKWEKRKGHDILIECFNEAFEEEDNVELWLVTFNPFLNEEQTKQWLNLAASSKLKDKIRVFNRLKTHDNVAEIMSYASCGVFPSRGEGWNLELLEMMSLGKPVIATNYSSHTEFCNKDNSYLIDITDKELAKDGKWFDGEGNWAKIDDDQKKQIIEYMRFVYNNKVVNNLAGIETAKKYSWENTANCINTILQNE